MECCFVYKRREPGQSARAEGLFRPFVWIYKFLYVIGRSPAVSLPAADEAESGRRPG